MRKKNVFFYMRLKNSLSIVVIVAVMLGLLLAAVNIFMAVSANTDAQGFIDAVVRNGGVDFLDAGLSQSDDLIGLSLSSTEGLKDYFSAYTGPGKNIVRVIHNFSLPHVQNLVESIVSYSVKFKKDRGHRQGMAFSFVPQDEGYMLVVADRTNEDAIQKRMIFFSVLVFLFGLLLFFQMAWWLSKSVAKPVEEAFNRQRQFVSDASHELKTPIAVISANISALEQEQQHCGKWLGYIKMENERMGQLVADMLYLAREDSGVITYEMLPFDFANMAACAVLPFESLAYEQGKHLFLEVPDEPLEIVGDQKKLKQAVIILTDNAMKNSDRGAEIRVTVGRSGQKAFVKVYNTGQGIPVSERKKIFDRFYRSDSSRTRDTGGCGLGLPIAWTIAAGHGGKILVESEEGSFAEFTLSVPVAGGRKKR